MGLCFGIQIIWVVLSFGFLKIYIWVVIVSFLRTKCTFSVLVFRMFWDQGEKKKSTKKMCLMLLAFKEKKLTWKKLMPSAYHKVVCWPIREKKKKKKAKQVCFFFFLSRLKLSIWRLLKDWFFSLLVRWNQGEIDLWQANCCLNYSMTFGLLVEQHFSDTALSDCPLPFATSR